jgi:hypothetical protein
VRVFLMTAPGRLAADLVAGGRLTHGEVAARVGVDRVTLWRWRRRPEFRARVDRLLGEIRAECRRRFLAGIAARLAGKSSRGPARRGRR